MKRTPLHRKTPLKARTRLQATVRPGNQPTKQPRNTGRLIAPGHLAWVRSLACAVPGCRARPCDAHHVRDGTGGGTGFKPGDDWTVPLCHRCHLELHQVGGRTMALRHGLDLRQLALSLAQRSAFLSRDGTPDG